MDDVLPGLEWGGIKFIGFIVLLFFYSVFKTEAAKIRSRKSILLWFYALVTAAVIGCFYSYLFATRPQGTEEDAYSPEKQAEFNAEFEKRQLFRDAEGFTLGLGVCAVGMIAGTPKRNPHYGLPD